MNTTEILIWINTEIETIEKMRTKEFLKNPKDEDFLSYLQGRNSVLQALKKDIERF